MSPEFIRFLTVCSIWCPIGWSGMAVIAYYRWRYMYKPILLGQILGWGLLIGGVSGPLILGFMLILALMHINWDMDIVKRRIPSAEAQRRYYDSNGRHY